MDSWIVSQRLRRVENEIVPARPRPTARRQLLDGERCPPLGVVPACRATRRTPSPGRAARAPRRSSGSRRSAMAVAVNCGPTRIERLRDDRALGRGERLHLAQQLRARSSRSERLRPSAPLRSRRAAARSCPRSARRADRARPASSTCPSTGVTGASSTGRFCTATPRARSAAASRAAPARRRSSGRSSRRIPTSRSTSVRTPMPYDSVSLTPVTCRSRVAIDWRR